MIKLWETKMPYAMEDVDFVPEIRPYAVGSKGAVIIFPGGAYQMRADHEGTTIAEWFNSIGITAFVVEYRVAPYKHPAELSDAMRAVRYVRANADKYGIDKNKIAVMGFSAGGHLAGSVSVHYDDIDTYEATDEIDKESARPDASILCYPVIDMYEYRHDISRQNLLGARTTEEMKEYMSLYENVTSDTPEAFIWHTSSDSAVPVMNSLLYAQALSDENINYEMHIYPMGGHGLGLAPEVPYVAKWADNLDAWLTNKGWK